MTPRGYLFDYGGTLDGEGWHWFDRTVYLYRRAGCGAATPLLKRAFYTAERIIAEEAPRDRYRLRPLIERHVELQMAVLGAGARRVAPAVVAGFCAITEDGWRRARATLRRLGGAARLGVVSNFYGNLRVLLEEGGLSPLLDAVVESAHVGVEKPDPAIYRLAAERLGLPPADILMVGDSFERDVRAARAAGMRAIWLRRGVAAAPEAGVAERVVAALSEVGEPAAGR
ncbi:MAG: HAD family hydrolase [Deltaproteobacteria bacterium]|nr:HAD family hydrolase [Deltaproteobacteria bacterium]